MISNKIKIFQHLLEEIDSTIDLMVNLSHEDFLRLHNYFRSLKTVSYEDISAQNIGEIVKHLQYHDALVQRCTHIKIIHFWILNDLQIERYFKSYAPNQESNLIRLNQLQFQTTTNEYLCALDQILSAPLLRDKKIFLHYNLVAKAQKVLDWKFSEALKAAPQWSGLTLQAKLAALQSLYSMQTERIVLHAYQQEPGIHHQQVIALAKINNNGSSIELF